MDIEKIYDSHFAIPATILSIHPQCSYHPSLKKPPFTENGDHHRNPQLDTIQKSTDHGELNPNGKNYIIFSASMVQGNTIKEETKRL